VGFSGAEAEQLEALAKQVEAASRHIGGVKSSLTSTIGSAPWSGQGADHFRQRWTREYARSMSDAQAFLREAGRVLHENARQQREASAADGGQTAVGGSSHKHWWDSILDAIRRLIRDQRDPKLLPVFQHGLRPEDIHQGAAGDCWLLASLGAIVTTPGGAAYIKSMIHENGDGTYTVTFADGTKVTVDDTFAPESVLSNRDKWVFIIESAFAKKNGGLRGDYMDGNSVVTALAALGLSGVQWKGVADLSDADLAAILTSGKPLVAVAHLSTPQDGAGGLTVTQGPAGEHAISVISHTGTTVTMRNPWGNNDHLVPPAGITLNDDGTFTVTFEQFRQLFLEVDWADAP